MNIISAIILGFIEGATEFIPVSSTGHLIIARKFLGLQLEGLAFDAVLQLSASFAVIVYFRKDIYNLILSFFKWITRQKIEKAEKILFLAIIFGTIPAIVIGLLLETKMETIFRNTDLVAGALIIGSVLFWIAEKFAKNDKELTLKKGIVIGFFQSLALVPGISRSGATISGGLLLGLTREMAVRFSFLLSLPILLGAGSLKVWEVRSELFTNEFGLVLFIGSVISFVTALFAINFLIKYLKNHNLNVFIWYRIALSLAIFFI